MSPAVLRSTRSFSPFEVVLLLLLTGGTAAWLASNHAFAPDAAAQNGDATGPRPAAFPPPGGRQAASPLPVAGAADRQADSAAATPHAVGLGARLKEAGAGTCAAQIDGMAAGAMQGVAQLNTVSNWATTAGDTRIVSVSIGQKYRDGSTVPYGVTSIVAAPNGRGSCDSQALQVTPSPLSCSRLRSTLSASGKQAGDLAGVTLIQDGGTQFLLVPTAADTCVLVGLRVAYAK